MMGDPPNCPIHLGPMKLDIARDGFVCLGWDGEGCDEFMSMEDYVDMRPM
jgi:hypothetical protein